MMIDKKDTIAAIATPAGRGGIGIIRLSGPLAFPIICALTGKKIEARQASYCSLRDPDGLILDKGIVIYFSAPGSYTGEDVVEIQGHGGPVILQTILSQVLRQGARLARPGEFTERAFLNNKLDLIQAEAVADLIDSSSEKAARSAMRSLAGEFSARIGTLLAELIKVRVFIEASLDFPEEEIDFLDGSEISQKTEKCLCQLVAILSGAQKGRALGEGFNVAIIGRPNVGKSSLFNALSQSNRAIVTGIPGTTRDTIEQTLLIEGIPLRVTDTAGIRQTKKGIEQEGIRRAWSAVNQADLVLLVEQVQDKKQQPPHKLAKHIPAGIKTIIIYNKIDLAGLPARVNSRREAQAEVYLSAKTREGLDLLKDQIQQVLGMTNMEEDVYSARARHVEALQKAKVFLEKGVKELAGEKPAAELVAEDLQQAQRNLESITGESTADDLLGEIFSGFCIGK